MRILMALWDGGGTVPVEVGVARLLVQAGHEVTVVAEPAMQAGVTAAGARFRPWRNAPHSAQQALADWECRTPLTLFPRLLNRLITGPSARYADDVRTIVTEEAAYDVAVVDFALMGAIVGTESLGIPTAVTMPGTYLRPTAGEPPFGLGLAPATRRLARARDQVLPPILDRVWDLGLRDLNTTRRGLGLAPVRHVWSQLDLAARVLVLTAEAFDFPPGRRPPNVRYVGPVLDDPYWAGPDVEPPPGDDPLVLVSTSTGRTRGAAEQLRRVVDALAEAPVRAVVTTGPAVPPVAAPRPGILVVPAASHAHLLPHADLVVTHGGHGTVIKALAAGKSCLVLPLGRDQPDIAARVVAHHAGLRLPATAAPARIAHAVGQILGDGSYAAAAEVLGSHIRAQTGSRRILAEVGALA